MNALEDLFSRSKKSVKITERGFVIDGVLRVFAEGRKDFCEENMTAVATDIFGGVFAVSGETVMYFAPDTLEWEDMELDFPQFLSWASQGDTETFYSSWLTQEVRKMAENTGFDEGILIYPFLWSKECSIETASKKIVPLEELYGLNMDFKRKFDGGK